MILIHKYRIKNIPGQYLMSQLSANFSPKTKPTKLILGCKIYGVINLLKVLVM